MYRNDVKKYDVNKSTNNRVSLYVLNIFVASMSLSENERSFTACYKKLKVSGNSLYLYIV